MTRRVKKVLVIQEVRSYFLRPEYTKNHKNVEEPLKFEKLGPHGYDQS